MVGDANIRILRWLSKELTVKKQEAETEKLMRLSEGQQTSCYRCIVDHQILQYSTTLGSGLNLHSSRGA